MRSLESLVHNITEGRDGSHAFIIEGRAAEGRDMFVRDLIKGLGCSEIDVVSMNRSGKTGYLKDDALPFMERLGMSPYGKYLVGIINDAELMSDVVQNKLLKTLEEPSEGVLILLATSRSDELLRTVKSRCSLVRVQEFEGYGDEEDEKRTEDLMAGVMMLLTGRDAFYEFREFLDKNIKTNEDALEFIASAEDRLRKSMTEGKGINLSADRIETAEKTAMDIIKGMDKNRALKRLYLEFCDSRTHRA